jgi:capsule biosynthesis phosphatase
MKRQIRQSKVIVIDVDGTLCPVKNKNQEYADLQPYSSIVQKMREYHKLGFYIVLQTARNMRTHNGCLGLINKHTAKVMLDWLERHNIPYDEIYYGKPWQGAGGFYVDDKTIRPDEFVSLTYEQIMAIVEPSGSKS